TIAVATIGDLSGGSPGANWQLLTGQALTTRSRALRGTAGDQRRCDPTDDDGRATVRATRRTTIAVLARVGQRNAHRLLGMIENKCGNEQTLSQAPVPCNTAHNRAFICEFMRVPRLAKKQADGR
ncbi:hypothetical protein X777_07230, partial [Ooceraea biroi]